MMGNPVRSDGMANELVYAMVDMLGICSILSPNHLAKDTHLALAAACEHYLSQHLEIIRIRDDQIEGARLGAIRKAEKKAAALAAANTPQRLWLVAAKDATLTELEE